MFHHHNSAISCLFLTDYNYLCHIRATANWHKKEAWYERIYATAGYQGFEHSEDVRLNVKNLLVPIKVQRALFLLTAKKKYEIPTNKPDKISYMNFYTYFHPPKKQNYGNIKNIQ